MKQCEVCNVEISIYSRYCPEHAAEIRKARDRARKRQQYADGESYAKVRQAQERQRNEKRTWICKFLSENPCVDCGESDLIVLEFDHTGSTQKVSDISRMLNNGTSLKRLIEEVNKCEVRCCNCHRRKTISRFGGSYRTKYAFVG